MARKSDDPMTPEQEAEARKAHAKLLAAQAAKAAKNPKGGQK